MNLVERLRTKQRILDTSPTIGVIPLCMEAADAIEQLTAERDALRSALDKVYEILDAEATPIVDGAEDCHWMIGGEAYAEVERTINAALSSQPPRTERREAMAKAFEKMAAIFRGESK